MITKKIIILLIFLVPFWISIMLKNTKLLREIAWILIGMIKTSDTSWLTPWPVNPLNNGQYVNNGDSNKESKNPPNVCYQG